MPISKHSTLPEMKDYIRKNKLKIKLTQKKADILAELDKGGHIHKGQRTGTITSKNMPKTTPSQIKMSVKPSLNTKKIEPKTKKPSLKDILLNLDIDVSKKIADAVEEDNKIDFYEITENGGFEADDEMKDMRKSFKPDGNKDIFGRVPKWIDGVTGGNAGTTGTLTKAKARKIKNKYKKLTIKRFVETDKSPYYKLVDV